MALTADERLMVFEIFEFPPNAEVVEMWGAFGRANAVQQYSFRSATEAIDDLLDNHVTAAQEVVIQALVVEWKDVRTSELELKKAETVEGVVSSSEKKRLLIRRRLQIHVPVYLQGEIETLQNKVMGGGQMASRIPRA